jgi:large subunit ribosomal protein L28
LKNQKNIRHLHAQNYEYTLLISDVKCYEIINSENNKYIYNMSRVCQITGKSVMIGNNVSHSKRRTKREFCPNLKTRRFWLEDEKRFITLKVSAAGIRTINKKGLKKVLADAKAMGLISIY